MNIARNHDMDKLQRALKELKRLWDWNSYYWFPLEPASRNDLLAFDCNQMEAELAEIEFQDFITAFYQKEGVYVFSEYDGIWVESPPRGFGYWHSELCITDFKLRNVVYWSHEGTVTLGGKRLISSFKKCFPFYKKMICRWGYQTFNNT